MGLYANQKLLEFINKAVASVKETDSEKLAKTLNSVLTAAGVDAATASNICSKLPDDEVVRKVITDIYEKYLKNDKKLSKEELEQIIAELKGTL